MPSPAFKMTNIYEDLSGRAGNVLSSAPGGESVDGTIYTIPMLESWPMVRRSKMGSSEVSNANSRRVLWGSDWPHTQRHEDRVGRDRTREEEFLEVDDRA